MGTTADRAHEAVVFTDWHQIFADLAGAPSGEQAGLDQEIEDASSSYALALFSDAHNASYYINSYTTKVNPTMDDVLRNLLDGVRRLQGEWQDREAKLAEEAASTADGIAAKRREDFRRTMQVLSRFETCFRRAAWKSGCEMVFLCCSGTSPS